MGDYDRDIELEFTDLQEDLIAAQAHAEQVAWLLDQANARQETIDYWTNVADALQVLVEEVYDRTG